MTVHGGNFRGWPKFDPGLYDECKLWLPGREPDSLVVDGSSVSGWLNGKEDFSVFIPDDPLFGTIDQDAIISTNNVENGNTFIYDGNVASFQAMNDKTYAGSGADKFGISEFNIDDLYKMTFDVWVDADASNSHIAIRERTTSYRDLSGFGTIRGAGWVTMDLPWNANSAYDYFRFYPSNNGTSAYNGSTSNDKFKIRNLTYYWNKGPGQYTTADQPSWDGTDTITFNDTDDYFLSLNNWISEYSSDKGGEFYIVGKRNLTTVDSQFISINGAAESDNFLIIDHARAAAGELPNDIRINASIPVDTNHGIGSDYSNTTNFDILNYSSAYLDKDPTTFNDPIIPYTYLSNVSKSGFTAITTDAGGAGVARGTMSIVVGQEYRVEFDMEVTSLTGTLEFNFRTSQGSGSGRSTAVDVSNTRSYDFFHTVNTTDTSGFPSFVTSNDCNYTVSNFRISQVGGQYKLYKNEVELIPYNVNGVNDGAWIGDLTDPSVFTIGARFLASPYYGNCDIKEIIYFSPVLNRKKRRAVHEYLNIKYEIY